jgi:hypothetical protein
LKEQDVWLMMIGEDMHNTAGEWIAKGKYH